MKAPPSTMTHIALLGDSVFDNGVYVSGEPDVAANLRSVLGPSGKVTLLAVDGSTTTSCGPQLDRIPAGVTHLVLSLGGNDALMSADLLDTPTRSTGAALEMFRERLDAFETNYGYVLEALVECGIGRPLVCTIYNGNLDAPDATRARTALQMFNDTICQVASRHALDVLDLRSVCNGPDDFANPIEPSGSGGRKIARAVAWAISTTSGGRLLRWPNET